MERVAAVCHAPLRSAPPPRPDLSSWGMRRMFASRVTAPDAARHSTRGNASRGTRRVGGKGRMPRRRAQLSTQRQGEAQDPTCGKIFRCTAPLSLPFVARHRVHRSGPVRRSCPRFCGKQCQGSACAIAGPCSRCRDPNWARRWKTILPQEATRLHVRSPRFAHSLSPSFGIHPFRVALFFPPSSSSSPSALEGKASAAAWG